MNFTIVTAVNNGAGTVHVLTSKSCSLCKNSGGGSFAKLGAQYITRDPKIGCADSAFSLLLAQILGAQMRTFAH